MKKNKFIEEMKKKNHIVSEVLLINFYHYLLEECILSCGNNYDIDFWDINSICDVYTEYKSIELYNTIHNTNFENICELNDGTHIIRHSKNNSFIALNLER